MIDSDFPGAEKCDLSLEHQRFLIAQSCPFLLVPICIYADHPCFQVPGCGQDVDSSSSCLQGKTHRIYI